MTSRSGTELAVPDAAIEEFCIYAISYTGNEANEIRAIAAPVVAAELRRLADDLMRDGGLQLVAAEALLRHRATELDGGTS